MKFFLSIFFTFIVFIISAKNIYAQQLHVLPYPSEMPGSKLYALYLIKEAILKYWYFGNFSQFTYNLMYADKYLVEAKTLFEYQQYLLGSKALKKSDTYFQNAPLFLTKAQKEGKDISQKQRIYAEAAQKHTEILLKLRQETPKDFLWQPEKSGSSMLELWKEIDESIKIRTI